MLNAPVNSLYKSTDLGESFEQIITFEDDNGYDIWTPRYVTDNLYLIHNIINIDFFSRKKFSKKIIKKFPIIHRSFA